MIHQKYIFLSIIYNLNELHLMHFAPVSIDALMLTAGCQTAADSRSDVRETCT